MPFIVYLAWKFLMDGRAQSALIITGVAIGVSVQVFVTALIDGLQRDLIAQTVDAQPHIRVAPPREQAHSLRPSAHGDIVVTRHVRAPHRPRSIDGWPRLLAATRRRAGVRAAAPTISGPGIAIHGEATSSVVVQGIEPESWNRIVPVAERLESGTFVLGARDAVIGAGLAGDLGVRVNDFVRIETGGGRGELYTVRGTFDLGNQEANSRWALVSLRSAQMLFDLPGGATRIDVALHDVFAADAVAAEIGASSGLDAESWMTSNAQLLSALRSQASSTRMIEAFVLVAVAMGITSVLVVSVVERRGQIGILRAVGATRRTVMMVFLLQGAAMGLVGSAFGCLLGAAFARSFQWAMVHGGGVVHRIDLTPGLFARATAIAILTGVLAAVFPARHAARLDPAVAIRHV